MGGNQNLQLLLNVVNNDPSDFDFKIIPINNKIYPIKTLQLEPYVSYLDNIMNRIYRDYI